jgi:hypothetical protein
MANSNHLPHIKKKVISYNAEIIIKYNIIKSLLNVAYKIFTDMWAQHIKIYTKEILSEYQTEVRQGHKTTDHIYN